MNSLQGLPEYSCGGASRASRAKGEASKRRRAGASGSRKRGFKGPSLHTGAQTAPNTKGGRRIQTSLPGQGSRVDGNNHLPTASAFSSAYKSDANSTFRKRTQTASARELRAEAAMRRMAALKAENVDVKPAGGGDAFWPEDSKVRSGGSSPSGSSRTRSRRKTPTESETETEDEEDSKDGGLVIRLDDSSADEAELSRPAADSSSSSSGTVRVKDEQDHSTFASSETQKQRLERSKLYRQHELKQAVRCARPTTIGKTFARSHLCPLPALQRRMACAIDKDAVAQHEERADRAFPPRTKRSHFQPLLRNRSSPNHFPGTWTGPVKCARCSMRPQRCGVTHAPPQEGRSWSDSESAEQSYCNTASTDHIEQSVPTAYMLSACIDHSLNRSDSWLAVAWLGSRAR